jgi:hypothetical protein
MDIQIMDANPIYQGEIYRLKFEFSSNYPIGIVTLLHTLFPQLITPSRTARGRLYPPS